MVGVCRSRATSDGTTERGELNLAFLRRFLYLFPFYRKSIERDMQKELDSLRNMGAPSEFGNLTRVAENARDIWRWHWLENFGQDVGTAWRAIRRQPALTIVAIVSLSSTLGS